MTTAPPVACTLSAGDHSERLKWIAELNGSALLSYRQEGCFLELDYAPTAIESVRRFIRQEQECCAFLRFDLKETSLALRVTVEAPKDTPDAAAAIFAPLLTGAVSPGSHRMASVAATTSAVAAVACGVCCVLPFAFPAVAGTMLGAGFAAFAGVYSWATRLALGLVAASWALVAWQSFQTRRRPNPDTLRAMGLATIFLGVALSWPMFEPHIIAALKAR